MNLVSSSRRGSDHGDEFTPEWMVEAMLNLVKDESERLDARFLDPTCGRGDDLEQVLRRKLATVDLKYGHSDVGRRHFALLALMCLYGIDPDADNIVKCRSRLLHVLADHVGLAAPDELCRAGYGVLTQNIVHDDALKRCMRPSQRFTFAEWRYLGSGKFQRRDFRFDNLLDPSGFNPGNSPFGDDAQQESFAPARIYPSMTVSELATAAPGAAG